MVWVHFEQRMAWVEWWPPARELHYPEICCSIYEFLRQPPELAHMAKAEQYLQSLLVHPHARLQQHRIHWTRQWIAAAKVAAFVG